MKLSNQKQYLGYLLAVSLFVLLFATFETAHAEFTAETIGNYGNITVIEVDGNYDVGTLESPLTLSRKIVAQEFYRTHPDNYDFLVVITNFDFAMDSEAVAFYSPIFNDVQGIGLDQFDLRQQYGSVGRLQGTIDMGFLDNITSDPMDDRFAFTMGTLTHELAHRWVASVEFIDNQGLVSDKLLGKAGSHWSFLLDSAGSLMYGNSWQDNGDGTFTTLPGRRYLSTLDLYLMGMTEASTVVPMLLIDSNDVEPIAVSKTGVTVVGTGSQVTIADIVAHEGARQPSFAESQKDFKVGCILLTRPETFTGAELPQINNIIKNWPIWFASLTDGRGSVGFDASPDIALPVNPGITETIFTPRTTPFAFDEAVAWLNSKQETDGHWQENDIVAERDTVTSYLALVTEQNKYTSTLDWFVGRVFTNNENLSRTVLSLHVGGREVDPFLSTLVKNQNEDGGWGSGQSYQSNSFDTAQVLYTLGRIAYSDFEVISKAVIYLQQSQNEDGGWGSERSQIPSTGHVLQTLEYFKDQYDTSVTVEQGRLWLLARQNDDGGFGIPSTYQETAAALFGLEDIENKDLEIRKTLLYLLDHQNLNGSWADSNFQTATILSALKIWQENVYPDLQITASDISFLPETITVLPQDISVTAVIFNEGITVAKDVQVVLYDGAVGADLVVETTTVTVYPQSSASVSFTLHIEANDGKAHQLFIGVNHDANITESITTNNTAVKILDNQASVEPELSIVSENIIVTPQLINSYPQQLTFEFPVKNTGYTDAVGVTVAVYDDAVDPSRKLSEQIINIAKQSETSCLLSFTAELSHSHRYLVFVDANESIAEPNELNNQALKVVYEGLTHDFAIADSSVSVSTSSVVFGESITISAQIQNYGTANGYDIPVDIYLLGTDGRYDITTQTVDVPAGGSVQISQVWQAAKVGDNMQLVLEVVSGLDELTLDNNKGETLISVAGLNIPNLKVNYEDLQLNPNPALEGGDATISIIVENDGFIDATDVSVDFFLGDPDNDGILISTETVPVIAVGQKEFVTFTWSPIDVSGQYYLTAVLDRENLIKEVNEEDNSAFIETEFFSLPDLILVPNSIIFLPQTPKEGDVVELSILIENYGEQDAVNVPILIRDGENVLQDGVVPFVGARSNATFTYDFDTTGQSGSHLFVVDVDLQNNIPEQSDTNNRATRSLGVQDDDLWLSEQLISPNSDGVQDETSFFFRLPAERSVQIVVFDKHNRAVRTFQGSEYENATGGMVTWDGRNDRQRIVADGQYDIQVQTLTGSLIVSLPVIVDTNRSPLVDAIGTEYLLNRNLTCMLPAFGKQEYLANESAIVFSINNCNDNAPEYPTGLYSMGPDGKGITRLIPWDWNRCINPDFEYSLPIDFVLSPQGDRIAFIIEKHVKGDLSDNGFINQQLWTVDPQGNNLELIYTFEFRTDDLRQYDEPAIRKVKKLVWSPDGQSLACSIWKEGYYDLRIIDVESHSQNYLQTEIPDEIYDIGWSPNGSHVLAFYADGVGNAISLAGVIESFPYDLTKSSMWWGDNGQVFYVDDNNVMVATLGSFSDPKTLVVAENKIQDFALSGDHFAFVESDKSEALSGAELEIGGIVPQGSSDARSRLWLCSDTGSCAIAHDAPAPVATGMYDGEYPTVETQGGISALQWSPDGSGLLFETVGEPDAYDCGGYTFDLVEIKIGYVAWPTKVKKLLPVALEARTQWGTIPITEALIKDLQSQDDLSTCVAVADQEELNISDFDSSTSVSYSGHLQWFPDNEYIVAEDSNGVFSVNIQEGVKKYFPIKEYSVVSPNGRYLGYDLGVESDSICYGRGWQDRWAFSTMLNMTLELLTIPGDNGIALRGIAADMNFEEYQLDYALVDEPEIWHFIKPPAEQMVITDAFATWIPPEPGLYIVRLVVSDFAGNTKEIQKRVGWGKSFTVVNIYQVGGFISPNFDGIKDSTEIHYLVKSPYHLSFAVYNAEDRLIRSFFKDYLTVPVAGVEDFISWDGRDNNGVTVPDGEYRIEVLDLEFSVIVDNTPPLVKFEYEPVASQTDLDGGCAEEDSEFNRLVLPDDLAPQDKGGCIQKRMVAFVQDDHIESWVIEQRPVDEPDGWTVFKAGTSNLGKYDEVSEEFVLGEIANNWTSFSGKQFRLTASDLGGNKTTLLSGQMGEFFLFRWLTGKAACLSEEEGAGAILLDSDDCIDGMKRAVYPILAGVNNVGEKVFTYNTAVTPDPAYPDILIQESVVPAFQTLHLQYFIPGDGWIEVAELEPPLTGERRYREESLGELPEQTFVAARMLAVDVDGKSHYSNPVVTGNLLELQNNCLNEVEGLQGLLEPVSLLSMQYLPLDSDDEEWLEFNHYGGVDEDEVPFGLFPVETKPLEVLCTQKTPCYLRMVALTEEGISIISKHAIYPVEDCVGLDVEQTVTDGICGERPKQITFCATQQILPDSGLFFVGWENEVVYPDQTQVNGTSSSINLAPQELSPGEYQINFMAYFTHVDTPDEIRIKKITRSLIISDEFPTSSIDGITGCPLRFGGNGLDAWIGMNVDLHKDELGLKGIKRYALYYAYGTSPTASAFKPALTGSPNNLVQIGDGEAPVCFYSVSSSPRASAQSGLDVWNITDLAPGTYTLQLRIWDKNHNQSCVTTTVEVARSLMTQGFVDRRIISPKNQDGNADDTGGEFIVDMPATLSLVIENAAGNIVKTFFNQQPVDVGSTGFIWNGTDDTGAWVVDGDYKVKVYFLDECGNSNSGVVATVEVDNTPPDLAITFPRLGDSLMMEVEIRGQATDDNFANYTLTVQSDLNGPLPLKTSTGQVFSTGLLARWNTFELVGVQTLKLTASDRVGNEASVESLVDIADRTYLIKSFQIPDIFSPNGDGKIETCPIEYELNEKFQEPMNITIDIGVGSNVVASRTENALDTGQYLWDWDGKNTNTQIIAPDNTYTVTLTARLTSNTAVVQQEYLTVILDTTSPLIEHGIVDGSFLRQNPLVIMGSISDVNFAVSLLNLVDENGLNVSATSDVSLQNAPLLQVDELSEGLYQFSALAEDRAQIIENKNVSFTVDLTPPKVNLTAPDNNSLWGGIKTVVGIKGSIEEDYLESWVLRYKLKDSQDPWVDLVTGQQLPVEELLFSLAVGPDSGLIDGVYEIELLAVDKAGWESKFALEITVDNTPPDVVISSPENNSYIIQPMAVMGSVHDIHLLSYDVSLAQGNCTVASLWSSMGGGQAEQLTNASLVDWLLLPEDREYCLRLSAKDRLENKVEILHSVIIDTLPPAPPVLSGQVVNSQDAELSWSVNTEPDLAGYNLYRDNEKINTVLITATQFLDPSLEERVYHYVVKAVDLAGWESEPSNTVELEVDLTPPDAVIRFPEDQGMVSGQLEVRGTAFSQDDFKEYRLYAGVGVAPLSWQLLQSSPIAVSYGDLGPWNTITLAEGYYTLKLEAEDFSGNIQSHQVEVQVDNTPPDAPILLSALPIVSDVDLVWEANIEPDIAGYLLYRDHKLVNVVGTVVGDLSSYLLDSTSYDDNDLPDGLFAYFVMAMDVAGNISAPSNILTVDLDTHPPHAVISSPVEGLTGQVRFEDALMVKAQCDDLDIATVQFQYQKQGDVTWYNLGDAITSIPYNINLDPVELGLVFGDTITVQVLATDTHDNVDPGPDSIVMLYIDLTAPDRTLGLVTLTDGGAVTLTWEVNGASDLAGYNLYRRDEYNGRLKVNNELIQDLTYVDIGLNDDTYLYDITAVDTFDNESKPSEAVSALVYTPLLAQPFTPILDTELVLQGGQGAADADVILYRLNADDSLVSLVQLATAADGSFSHAVPLVSGLNWLTARVTDANGNKSKLAESVAVFADTSPAQPTGLSGVVDQNQVALTWDQNSEADLAGYKVFRDGVLLNQTVSHMALSASASSYDWAAYRAVDGAADSYWSSYLQADGSREEFLQIDFGSDILLNSVTIHWLNELKSADNFTLSAWSGYGWVTLAEVRDNGLIENYLSLATAYKTSHIQLVFTLSDTVSWEDLAITEVEIQKEQLLLTPEFTESGLGNGVYLYQVLAMDQNGYTSPFSDSAEINIGDVIPPSMPLLLNATALGTTISLNWQENLVAEEVVGYHVYRQSGSDWLQLSQAPVVGISFDDLELANGAYYYKITAVDQVGNESEPSNIVSATVSVAVPVAPVLTVTVPDTGDVLDMCWQYSDLADGFILFRSLSTGTGYTPLHTGLLTGDCYRDSGLTNGTTYYYVVLAVDSIGNQGTLSNEGQGMPQDLVLPGAPVFKAPTVSGLVYTTAYADSIIRGISEPGTTVSLVRSGEVVATTTALEEDEWRVIEFGDITQNTQHVYGLARDGSALLYHVYNELGAKDEIWLHDINTDENRRVVEDGVNPQWHPVQNQFIYQYEDQGTGVSNFVLFDLENNQSEVLVTDMDPDSSQIRATWSVTGTGVVVTSYGNGTYQLWYKDVLNDSIRSIIPPANYNGSQLIFSPDGERLASIVPDTGGQSSTLWITDVYTGATLDQVSGIGLQAVIGEWSPDGTKILFKDDEYNSGWHYRLLVVDLDSHDLVTVRDSLVPSQFQTWQGDSQNILTLEYANDTSSVLQLPLEDQASGIEMFTTPGSIVSGFSHRRGGLFNWISEGGDMNVFTPGGTFQFDNVDLRVGDNYFTAKAVDGADNESPYADEIDILLAGKLLPDLTVATEDIRIIPLAPIEGSEAIVNVTFSNQGNVAVKDVEVDIYLVTAEGQMEWVDFDTIPYFAAGSKQSVSFYWDTTGHSGLNRLYAFIDDENLIMEVSEYNNSGSREFAVTVAGGDVELTAGLNKTLFQDNEKLVVTLEVANSGVAQDLGFNVVIEDEQGFVLHTYEEFAASLDYGEFARFNLTWNTGVIYAGAYRVRIDMTHDQVTATQILPFAIESRINVEASVDSDKLHYNSFENAVITASMENMVINNPLFNIEAALTLSGNGVEETVLQSFANLLPGAEASFALYWNTGLYPPGTYSVNLAVSLDGQSVSTATTTFEVDEYKIVAGSINADPPLVMVGKGLNLNYMLTNNGNVDLVDESVVIQVMTGTTLVSEQVIQLSLPKTQTQTGVIAVAGDGLWLNSYSGQLLWQSGGNKLLDSTTFTVVDRTPPVVAITSPVEQSRLLDPYFMLDALVQDNASGVESVEYQIDDSDWFLLPVIDQVNGRYGAPWTAEETQTGDHVFSFRATDKIGNMSSPVAVTAGYWPDRTPPVVTIASPDGGDVFTTPVPLTITAVDEISDVVAGEYCFDGGDWQTMGQHPTLANGYFAEWHTTGMDSGTHVVAYRATDSRSNVSEPVEVSFVVDLQPPLVSVLSPEAGQAYTECPMVKRVTALDALSDVAVVEFSLDAGPWTPLPVDGVVTGQYGALWDCSYSDNGDHTLSYRATDSLGNQSEPVVAAFKLDVVNPFDLLTGTLTVNPSEVYIGGTIELTAVITNPQQFQIPDFGIQVQIYNIQTGEEVETFNLTTALPAEGMSHRFVVDTSTRYFPDTYTAKLLVQQSGGGVRHLDNAEFETLLSVVIDKPVLAGHSRLLVWVNVDQGECDRFNRFCNILCPSQDPQEDLLGPMLGEVTDQYKVVTSPSEFAMELRNPYYTDIMILGDYNGLGCEAAAELRERVYSGTGLISSLWLDNIVRFRPAMRGRVSSGTGLTSSRWSGNHGCFRPAMRGRVSSDTGLTSSRWSGNHGRFRPAIWDSEVFGVQSQCPIYADASDGYFVESPIMSPVYFTITGRAKEIDVAADATVAAWLTKSKNIIFTTIHSDHPAVVLHDYGQGKTAYFAFDLGQTITPGNYDLFKEVLANTLNYVHRDDDVTLPLTFTPVSLDFTGQGDSVDIRVTETFDDYLRLYDMTAMAWQSNPWQLDLSLAIAEKKSIEFLLLPEDIAGTYTSSSQIGFMRDMTYIHFTDMDSVVHIPEDSKSMLIGAISALEALDPSWFDTAAEINNAIAHLQSIQQRTIRKLDDIEANIDDFLGAINEIRSADLPEIHLLMAKLLRIEQARFTFFVPASDYVSGEVTLVAAQVYQDNSFKLSYTLQNSGPVNFENLYLQLSVVRDGNVLDLVTASPFVDLAAFGSVSGVVEMDAQLLAASNYELVLEMNHDLFLAPKEIGRYGVQVLGIAHAPVADAGGPYLAVAYEDILVDGSGSSDPDIGLSETGELIFDSITGYLWETDLLQPYDYLEASGSSPSLAGYEQPGQYEIGLTVQDNTSVAFPLRHTADLFGSATGLVTIFPEDVTGVDVVQILFRRLKVVWSATGATSYQVLRSSAGPNYGYEEIGTTSDTYLYDSSCDFRMNYWYRIQTENGLSLPYFKD